MSLPALLTKTLAKEKMDQLTKAKIPYLFIINYQQDGCWVIPLKDIDPGVIQYNFNGVTNEESKNALPSLQFSKRPISLENYSKGFDVVLRGLKRGDSFLTNLTTATCITTNYSLKDIFLHTQAKYRLWVKDHFCSFSPEIFIQVRSNRISTFPMKGTIDAAICGAEEKILNDPKESAEHATIVDLMRNDLSMVADHVGVKRYRYIDELKTNQGALLQVSSEIEGALQEKYQDALGSMIFQLLPAGSISGAPKAKTCEIIAEAETAKRGFYTGIAGIFDGENLDSGVLIRFIEGTEQGEKKFFSGGGITAKSVLENEYDELIQKVYIPFC